MPKRFFFSKFILFLGSITAQEGEKMPLDANNFVLRGCSLRNTDWIYGLITYTG
jgi:hypothetical protein